MTGGDPAGGGGAGPAEEPAGAKPRRHKTASSVFSRGSPSPTGDREAEGAGVSSCLAPKPLITRGGSIEQEPSRQARHGWQVSWISAPGFGQMDSSQRASSHPSLAVTRTSPDWFPSLPFLGCSPDSPCPALAGLLQESPSPETLLGALVPEDIGRAQLLGVTLQASPGPVPPACVLRGGAGEAASPRPLPLPPGQLPWSHTAHSQAHSSGLWVTCPHRLISLL